MTNLRGENIFSLFVCLSHGAFPGGFRKRPWQDSCCFLGQFFLHGRASRPPTYLVATPGTWCFEKPRSSADSDRQGLCVLSVWKRQTGPGICFQLLSLRRHRLAHGEVALHTDTGTTREKTPTSVESYWKISLSNTPVRECPAITSCILCYPVNLTWS